MNTKKPLEEIRNKIFFNLDREIDLLFRELLAWLAGLIHIYL